MKNSHPPEEHHHFGGNLRHYHRAGAQTQRTWDDWVDGGMAKKRRSASWLKIAGIGIAILGLSGIVIGLIVELS